MQNSISCSILFYLLGLLFADLRTFSSYSCVNPYGPIWIAGKRAQALEMGGGLALSSDCSRTGWSGTGAGHWRCPMLRVVFILPLRSGMIVLCTLEGSTWRSGHFSDFSRVCRENGWDVQPEAGGMPWLGLLKYKFLLCCYVRGSSSLVGSCVAC